MGLQRKRERERSNKRIGEKGRKFEGGKEQKNDQLI
jgi:hypothetical protein